MSQENVEIVRSLAEAFQHRDHERAFERYDRTIEWDTTQVADVVPDIAGIYHGHEGVRTYWRGWLAAWRDLRFEIEDVRDAGDDVVLVVRNQRQWGRATGIATEVPRYGAVFTIRRGKVTRVVWFSSVGAALEAVGLDV